MSNDYRGALWEAAKEDGMDWPELKGFLKGKKIDIGMFEQTLWMDLLVQHRAFHNHPPREQPSPTGSSDAVSLSDSAIEIVSCNTLSNLLGCVLMLRRVMR